MGKPTSQTLKPLPTYCLRALISCGTSDGSLNAKSITSPLRKKQTDRILNIDKQCRALRSKAMKKRHKITQEILAKSPKKKKRKSRYMSVTDLTKDNDDDNNKNNTKNVNNKSTHKKKTYEEKRADIAGKAILGLSKARFFTKKLKKKTKEHNERRRKTGKEDDGSIYVNPKHIALLRACGIVREAATTWLLNEDPHQDLIWEPYQYERILPHTLPCPPWPKPGILLNRKRIMERLTDAPCVTKQELRRIIKDEMTFKPKDDPKIMKELITIFGNMDNMRDTGIGPAYIVNDHLAKDLAPKFIPNTEPDELVLIARNKKQLPGPADYGDISKKLNYIKKIEHGYNAGWYSHSETLQDVLPRGTSEEPGPLDYVRTDDFGSTNNNAGMKFNSRGTTDVDIKIRTAKALPSPGQYNVQNDRLIRKFHSPSAFISDTNGESQLETIIRTSHQTPGPDAYKLSKSLDEGIGGGKFNKSKSKTELDWVILRSKEIPAGNHYFRRSNGIPPYKLPPGAPKFSITVPKTPIELEMERASKTPGPGAYKIKKLEIHGGVISKSEIPSDADLIAKRAAKIPGPARYADYFLRSSTEDIGGGRFSNAKPLTHLELISLRAAETPAPHDYDVNDPAMNIAGGKISVSKNLRFTEKIMRKAKESPGPPDYADYLMKDMSQDINGGRFSNANPKTEIEWVQLRAKETPGPNEYVLKYKLPNGGSFSTANPPSQLEQIITNSKKLPAPNAYNPKQVRSERAVIISEADPKGEFDWIIHRAKQTPAPHDYKLGSTMNLNGGVKFSDANPKSETEWIMHRSASLPAPDFYHPFKYGDPRGTK